MAVRPGWQPEAWQAPWVSLTCTLVTNRVRRYLQAAYWQRQVALGRLLAPTCRSGSPRRQPRTPRYCNATDGCDAHRAPPQQQGRGGSGRRRGATSGGVSAPVPAPPARPSSCWISSGWPGAWWTRSSAGQARRKGCTHSLRACFKASFCWLVHVLRHPHAIALPPPSLPCPAQAAGGGCGQPAGRGAGGGAVWRA